jgi:hypothetical protein
MPDNAPQRRAHTTTTTSTRRAPRENSLGKMVTTTTTTYTQSGGRRPTAGRFRLLCALAVTAAATLPTALAQSCIPLRDSSQCSAFASASISTDSSLTGLFPFLANVTDTSSFDAGLQQYIANGFTQQRYSTLIGCSSFDPSNSSAYYARYTASVLCNTMVQISISPCALTGDATRPLCVNTCVRYCCDEICLSLPPANTRPRPIMLKANNQSLPVTCVANQAQMLSAKFEPTLQTARFLPIRYPAHALQASPTNQITVDMPLIWPVCVHTALRARQTLPTRAASTPTLHRVVTMSSCPSSLLRPCSLFSPQLHPSHLRLPLTLHLQRHHQARRRDKAYP